MPAADGYVTLADALESNRQVMRWLEAVGKDKTCELLITLPSGEEQLFVPDTKLAGQLLRLTLETMGCA